MTCPEIWYVRDDGSNLDENLRDLTTVVLSAGLDLIDELHDPRRVIELIQTGALLNAGLASSARPERGHRGLSGRWFGTNDQPDQATGLRGRGMTTCASAAERRNREQLVSVSRKHILVWEKPP